MDAHSLLADERRRLADQLEGLTPTQWEAPSLCDGWSNHVVAAHLNLPWSVSVPLFAVGVLRARGNIDRAMDRFSREVAARLDPGACVTGLRTNASNRATPPGLGVEAPLTEVVVHGADVLQPLGLARDIDPDALRVALTFVTSRRAVRAFGARPVAGLVLEATDLDLRIGATGEVVSGPALALCGAVLGRSSFAAELTGGGVDRLVAPR